MTTASPTLSNLESIIKYIEKDYISEEIDDKFLQNFLLKHIKIKPGQEDKLAKKLRNIFLDKEQICELLGILNITLNELISSVNRIFPGFFTTKLKHYINEHFDYRTGQPKVGNTKKRKSKRNKC